jgi:hypothetical protein
MIRPGMAAFLVTVMTTMSLAACTGEATPQPTAGTPSATPGPAQILTWTHTASDSPTTDALVSGTLAVNDNGCVTIGAALLVAPPGSSVLADGSGVSVSSLGEHKFGDTLQDVSGGHFDITGTAADPAGISECLSSVSPEHEYTVVWGE